MRFAPSPTSTLSLTALGFACLTSLSACQSTPEKQAAKAMERQQQAKDLNEQALALMDKHAAKPDAQLLVKAEEQLREAIQLDPNLGPAHNNLGSLLFKQRKLYDAAWEFRTAAKLMPGLAEPIGNLGQVQELAGHLEEAQKNYEEALRLAPQNPVIIGDLARVQLRRNQYTPAVLATLKSIALNDPRPEWRAFAKAKVALWPQGKTKTADDNQQAGEGK